MTKNKYYNIAVLQALLFVAALLYATHDCKAQQPTSTTSSTRVSKNSLDDYEIIPCGAGRNSGRSNNSGCCRHLTYKPPGGKPKAKITPPKPLFNGKSPADSVSITLYRKKGQNTKVALWKVDVNAKEMCVDLSALPKAKYLIRFEAGESVQDYIIE